jgi:hypothetical protein
LRRFWWRISFPHACIFASSRWFEWVYLFRVLTNCQCPKLTSLSSPFLAFNGAHTGRSRRQDLQTTAPYGKHIYWLIVLDTCVDVSMSRANRKLESTQNMHCMIYLLQIIWRSG